MDWSNIDPFDPDTMMWLQVAVGFTGAMTLGYFWRWLKRSFAGVQETKAYFSPRGGCQDAVVQELQKARSEILVQAYSFTADPLTFGLVDAKNRGVTVDVLLDKSNEADRYSDLRILLDKGVQPLIDHDHAIAHNKIIIIDQKVVITGSYNFTNQAEGENAENLLIIKGSKELVKLYRENFLKHKAHCKAAQLKEVQKDRRAA